MRILLSGLWARRGLNAATVLMALVALTAALLGPMYSSESSEHLLDQRLGERAPYTLGLTDAVPAMTKFEPFGDRSVIADKSGRVRSRPPAALLSESRAAVSTADINRYWQPPVPYLYDAGGVLTWQTRQFVVPLYWRVGMCRLARVTGTCPTGSDQVLMQATMAHAMGLSVGGHLTLTYAAQYVTTHSARGGESRFLVEHDRPETRSFTLVGTYTIAAPETPAWFDSSRFLGVDRLTPQPSSTSGRIGPPKAPALLVAPGSMTSQSVVGGADRPIDPGKVGIDTMADARAIATSFVTRTINQTGNNPSPDLDLDSVFGQVRAEHTLLSRIMIAALAPLVVLVLLLLYGLVGTAALQRRPHVALAKLRGLSRAQVFRFAVAEPFLAIALAVPVAVAAALAIAGILSRARLGGTPVSIQAQAWLALVVVAGAAVLAATTAALSVIREPLSTSLAGSVGAQRPSRWATILPTAVVALAVAAVGQMLTSAHQGAQLLALLAPMFVALAAAVVGMVLLRSVSRLMVRRTARGGGTPAYLASRRLARRGDLLNLMVPLLLGVSMIGFSLSSSHASNAWRDSRARAEVGAARTFDSGVSPDRLVRVTHEVDPQGRYLMAAVLDNSGSGIARHVLVDSSRFANVVAWDPSWSSQTPAELQKLLEPRWKRLAFTGNELTVTVHAGAFRSAVRAKPQLWLKYVNDAGETRDEVFGTIQPERETVLHLRLFDCTRRCLVSQVFFAEQGQSVSDVDGNLTLSSITIDGKPADWGFDSEAAWRPAQPFPTSLIDPPLQLRSGPDGIHVRLYLGHLPPGPATPGMVSGIARMTPVSTPELVPILATRTTPATPVPRAGSGVAVDYPPGVVQGTALSGTAMPARIVARVAALPQLGDRGELADLPTELVEYQPPQGAVVVAQLWTAADTPASMLRALRDKGVGLRPFGNLAATQASFKGDAFSRGLQVFLGVGVLALLLAVFGVFASAVTSARWRAYEVASLRVVGVRQAALVRASVWEYFGILGTAVLLGVVSALVSLGMVLPAIGLGPAAPYDPKPAYGVEWLILLATGVGVLALALLVALLVSRRVTRLGRPSTLRWAEQG